MTAVALMTVGACASPATVVTYPDDVPVAADDRLYVSIGDSYAAGYQPDSANAGATSTNGFAYQITRRTAATARPLKLVNFGCSGITSQQLLNADGCAEGARGPYGAPYDGPQATAAERFVSAHRAQVALITVIIGGNDVQPCLLTSQGRIRGDTASCVGDAVDGLRSNLGRFLADLRAAAGPTTTIVGLTYPDIYLGAWVSSSPDARAIATGSVVLFRSILNPVLQQSYAAVAAAFVDITSATGAYDPLTTTVDQPPYGSIPQPVATVCALTYYCAYADPHPRPFGHSLIADEVQKALPAS